MGASPFRNFPRPFHFFQCCNRRAVDVLGQARIVLVVDVFSDLPVIARIVVTDFHRTAISVVIRADNGKAVFQIRRLPFVIEGIAE